jgi:uncharacterized repeat protein (TIGR01451 family)
MVSGSVVRARTVGRRALSLAGALAIAALLVGSPAAVGAASDPTITTPFPSVSVTAGSKVSFDLTVTAPATDTLKLAVAQLPSGWTATLRGGGYEVTAITAGPGSAAGHATLEVDVPETAQAGSYPVNVGVSGTDGFAKLDLEIRVSPEAGGTVTMTADFPQLSGASGTTFTFTLTLANDTPQDRTFAISANGPDGWQVTASPSGQAQASSVAVKASSSSTITVTANAPSTVPAGAYPILVKATESGHEVDAPLQVGIIGSYQLALTTPDQRLNAEGTAGGAIPFQLQVQNSGTAPLTAVKLTATPPTGWKITFSPSDTLDSVDPGTSKVVTANITPSDQAIAGDYVVTFSAANAQATATQDIRVTVDTSLTWAIVGIGLVVLAFVGLGWVFRRFGRR